MPNKIEKTSLHKPACPQNTSRNGSPVPKVIDLTRPSSIPQSQITQATKQPQERKPGLFSRFGKLILIGAGITGIAGNEYLTHKNLALQSEINEETTAHLTSAMQRIQDLDGLVSDEQTKNKAQEGQMNNLNDELARARTTNLNFFEKINKLKQEISSIASLEKIQEVAKIITPSTVIVEGEEEVKNPYTGQIEKYRGNGSGVILIGKNGERYILTNGHVTKNHEIKKDSSKDGVYHIKMYNGSDFQNPLEFDAPPVILSDGNRAYSEPDDHDLALLIIPPDVKLPPTIGVKIRDIEKNPLRAGEVVIAIGAPGGLRDSVTSGIISHPDRKIEGYSKNHHIQVDAPINFGNSGGGLFDLEGRLIGINSWKYRGDGLAASIRIDEALNIMKIWKIDLAL